jgi:hypothetical protein
MSGPYVYKAEERLRQAAPSPYVQQNQQQPHVSPFIPPANLAPSPYMTGMHYSPYNVPATLAVPGTPGTPGDRRVHFTDDPNCPVMTRPRSWHAADYSVPGWVSPNGGVIPILPPSPSAVHVMLSPPSIGHHRRHSFGQQAPAWYGSAGQPWPQHAMGMASPAPAPAPAPPKEMLHPYLDGSKPRSDFFFDLSSPIFNPQRRYPNGTLAAIPDAELDEPATHPAITKMGITHEAIAQWPIELDPKANGMPSPIMGLGLDVPSWVTTTSSASEGLPPMTLRDILESIWRILQMQISHLEWARLGKSEEHAIARAYTRRCKAAMAVSEDASENESSMGVKRVDFLLDKFMFRGLKPMKGSQGFERMQMILSARQ